ncbi:hypothetical protein V2O64_04130 [Verrucomicrobiaceae bacterium 227]
MHTPLKLSLKTVGQFLVGNREAIKTVASSPKALLLGLLFIVSAGLARNYDHHLLLSEPLWIGGPVAMALFSSAFIYFFAFLGRVPTPKTPYGNFIGFLICFTMTAPLAWLYGIPVENFTSPIAAAIFNFSILLIVSIWRVSLMVRVTSVLFEFHPSRAFALVSIPASAEMFFATLVSAMSIVGIMGGMSLSPADAFLLKATSFVSYSSLVVFGLGILTAIAGPRGNVTSWCPERPQPKIASASWLTAFAAIGLWLVIAIIPQQKLTTREHLRNLIKADQYEEASEFVKTKTQKDFPTHQSLFERRSTYFHPPIEMELLVHHNDWPEWLREELKSEVKTWMAGLPSHFDDQDRKEHLYQGFSQAPFTQQIADELTPGIKVSDYFPKDEEVDDNGDPQP